jgi:FAS-associated factor 2
LAHFLGVSVDSLPHQAAQKLQATTYPFVAFLALQPHRNPSTRPSQPIGPPILTVLSRHQGRCVPANAPTSSQAIIEHLQHQLLPRVRPFLERIQNSQRELDQARILREEQDRAFQKSARRDRERIANKLALEKQQAEARALKQDEIQMEILRQKADHENSIRRQNTRMEWRRWARRILVPAEEQNSKDGIRIAFHLPVGRRTIRQFSLTATLTSLYAFVDAQLIPRDLAAEEDPETPPDGNLTGEAALDTHILETANLVDEWWGFKLVLAYPRQEIKWEVGRQLRDVELLKGGGQVMVEMIEHRVHTASANRDDGFTSEDSE